MVSIVAAIHAPLIVRSAQGDVTGAGRRFVELLAKENFSGAVAQFDDTMKTVSPEPKLRETWQNIQVLNGPFQKQLEVRATKVDGYNVALVTCQFERRVLDMKVFFDAKGQVTGFFFVTTHPAANPGEPPPYARTHAFREKEFTVGRGEWQLPGTLTLLTAGGGPWLAVVLVHGSGPNDRDETMGANKPFRDLAWGLATKGIAVLRYEKRTREYAGHFTVREETIEDALSAVAQLRNTEGIDPKRIFVLGHSMGGMLAPNVGQTDTNIAGLIIFAGATRRLEDTRVEQERYLISVNRMPSAEAEAYLAGVESNVAKIKKLTAADVSSSVILCGAPPAYWLDWRHYDPLAIVKGLKQPLLILQGGRDYQVTELDFNRWKEALGSQPKATFKFYPKLNHQFITGEGRSTPDEYEEPGHVAEAVVTDIAEWIGAR